METDIKPESPLGVAIQNEVQSRLNSNANWNSSGVDEVSLTEYVLLLLNSGKPADEVASSLSEILPLAKDDGSLEDFARWIFQQAEGSSNQPQQQANAEQQQQTEQVSAMQGQEAAVPQDTDMGDAGAGAGESSIPKGPRAMNDNTRRMMGQINKNMDRTPDAALHRIQGSKGTGRVSTHQRGPPKGPRNMPNNRGNGGQRNNFRIQGMAGQSGMNANNALGNMTPQQQMQLLAMYEEQARMMAQFLSPGQQEQMFPNFPNGMPQTQTPNSGKSLFERVEHGGGNKSNNRRFQRNEHQQNDEESADVNMDLNSSMEAEQGSQNRPDPATSVCRFNVSCTKADCPYVHQSPAAPPGTTIDMDTECSFGAACKNRKCVGKHPSPAKRNQHKSGQECKFWPNCANPQCPFQHPSMPPCRNGADCNVEDCKFSHSKVVCKYNPCLNPGCMFKHAEGQKRGTYEDKVWINQDEEDGQRTHVSERKFEIDTGGEVEAVIPGKATEESIAAEGVVT